MPDYTFIFMLGFAIGTVLHIIHAVLVFLFKLLSKTKEESYDNFNSSKNE